MAAHGDLLFYDKNGVDLDGYLRSQIENLRDVVNAIPEKNFTSQADSELAKSIYDKAKVAPLNVNFEAAVADVKETTVDVTGRFDYDMGDGQTVSVPGYRVTKSIPFDGSPLLWKMKTNPWGMNPPRGTIHGGVLTIGIDIPAAEKDRAKAYIDDSINRIPEYLERQKAQIERYNESILPEAVKLIAQRRKRLEDAAELKKSL